MSDKSLAAWPCGLAALCGINVRFQTVSRSQRQVPHVLLTRPPLSSPRRGNSVRLACVRRAASVRPEPGSNSSLNVISSGLPISLRPGHTFFKDFFPQLLSSSLTIELSVSLGISLCNILLLRIQGFPMLFNFQGPMPPTEKSGRRPAFWGQTSAPLFGAALQL